MRHFSKRFAGVAVAAGMLISSAAAVLPQNINSLVVYAGDNDFAWSTYNKKDSSWWTSGEATSLGDEIIKYQLSDGGWRKDMKTATSGSWNKSTIDNNATWGQIRYLARLYTATKTEKYKTSCLKGIDLLINGQYSNGGWPQVFNDAGTYHAHITYNDTAMVAVLRVMQEVSNGSGDFAFVDSTRRKKADNAVNKGVECILNTQIKVNGTLTAWCQQHDEKTLAPASARAYELPSICTSESVGIVDFLRSLPDEKKTAAVVRSINAAVRWFDSAKIENKKWDWNSDKSDKVLTTVSGSTIWARYYYLDSPTKPLFADRDGKSYDDVTYAEIPEKLSGAETIVTPCDGKNIESDLASFTANGDITVYIALDNRVTSVPSWLSGWNNTGLTTKNSSDVTYNIYRKDFKSGEKVTLGTNGQSTGCVGYIAFVKKYVPEPISGNKIADLTPNENALPTLWKIDTDIQVGDPLYTDRDGVTYTEIPSGLVGAEAIVTPCDGKKVESDLAKFTAKGDITVYVALDSRVTSIPSWLSGWNNTGLTAKNSQDVTYNLYSKEFKSGESVTLGSNGQSAGCTGYTVFVADSGADINSGNVPGDVNMDGYFNTADLVIFQKWLLAVPNTTLANWEAADLNKDGRLDTFDMTLIRKALIEKINEPVNTTPPATTTTTAATTATTTTTTTTATTATTTANIYESADFKFSGKVYIVGDSTVCNYDEALQKSQNRCGWGMKIAEQYNGVTVTNLARAGRSSRSFLTENEYKTMCNSIGKGDYLFVQFGHNDEKTDDADRGTYPGLDFSTLDKDGKNSAGQYSYEWVILNKYVKVAQAKGATVVLVTPVTRRGSNGLPNYKSHTAYAEGLVKLGQEYNIPVIDMTTKTTELYTQLYNSGGADATAELHCYSDDTRTSIDNTHLSIKGCTIIADMIADETANLNLKISEKLK